MHELNQQLKQIKDRFYLLETIFDETSLTEKIRQIDAEIELESFWDNNDNAQKIFQELNQLKRQRDNIQEIKTAIENSETGLELLSESPNDSEISTEISGLIDSLEKKSVALKLNAYYHMSGTH